MQLVKIDHVILLYLSLTSTALWLWIITFVSWCKPWIKNGRFFNKFKPLKILIRWFLLVLTPEKVVIYQTIKESNLAGFLASKSLKFGFVVKQFATFLIGFSVWYLKLNPLPDLLYTRFTINEIGKLVLWWVTLERKNMQIPEFFWQNHIKITSWWQSLVHTKSRTTKCENISNTGCVLLMFY